MNFSDALKYPFNSLAKVFTIVLVMTISIAVFVAMIVNSFDWSTLFNEAYWDRIYNSSRVPAFPMPSAGFVPGVIGLFVVMIVQGLFLSGYGVRVIRHIMDGYEKLPAVELGQDIKNGFYLFLSSILYGLLFMPLMIIAVMLMGMFAGPNGEGGGMAFLTFCSAFIGFFVLAILFGWGYFVGMARFAAEGEGKVVFQIGTNISIAKDNLRNSLSMTGYQILLGLVYWFASQFVGSIGQFAAVPFVNGDSMPSGTMIVAMASLFLLISFIQGIFQNISGLHLIAQYAYKVGIHSPENIDFDFSRGPWSA